MNQDKQPEALLRAGLTAVRLAREGDQNAAETIRTQHARITELEAELAALKAAPAAQAGGPVAIAEITSASHDAAEFGERGLCLLADFQHLEYGTKLYAHATPPEPEGATIELMKLVDAWYAEMRTGNHISQGMARQRIVMLADSISALRATPPTPAAVASEYAHRELYFAAYALCDGVCEDHPEIDNVFSIGTHGRLCNALAGLDAHYDVSSPDERISKDQLPPADPQAQDVQDAGLLDWLSKQYIGPDFRMGDPETEVVVIEMPKGCSYCGDFKVDMRAAIAASAKGGA